MARSVPRVVVYPPLAPGPKRQACGRTTRRTLGAASDTTVIVIASRFERPKGHLALLEAVATLRRRLDGLDRRGVQRPSEDALSTELTGVRHRARPRASAFVFWANGVMFPAISPARPTFSASPISRRNRSGSHSSRRCTPAFQWSRATSAEPVKSSRPKCGILLPPGDVAALRDALQRLVSNPQRRQELGAAGPVARPIALRSGEQIHRLEQALAPRAEQALA